MEMILEQYLKSLPQEVQCSEEIIFELTPKTGPDEIRCTADCSILKGLYNRRIFAIFPEGTSQINKHIIYLWENDLNLIESRGAALTKALNLAVKRKQYLLIDVLANVTYPDYDPDSDLLDDNEFKPAIIARRIKNIFLKKIDNYEWQEYPVEIHFTSSNLDSSSFRISPRNPYLHRFYSWKVDHFTCEYEQCGLHWENLHTEGNIYFDTPHDYNDNILLEASSHKIWHIWISEP